MTATPAPDVHPVHAAYDNARRERSHARRFACIEAGLINLIAACAWKRQAVGVIERRTMKAKPLPRLSGTRALRRPRHRRKPVRIWVVEPTKH